MTAPVAALLLAVLASGCSTENTPVAELAATAAASHWLHVVDVDSLEIAYQESSRGLRERREMQDWIDNVRDARTPFGEFVGREIVARRYEDDSTRYSSGVSAIVTFETDFTEQEDVEEILVMELEDGRWRPGRYIIDPRP
jgi:hypothetical protein